MLTWQVRTCFLDDVVEQFAESYGDARCNIVLLGAGFDMRLHRLPLPGSACLFEVDAAGTQRAKIELLSSVAPELLEPGKVTYVESDLRSLPCPPGYRPSWSSASRPACAPLALPRLAVRLCACPDQWSLDLHSASFPTTLTTPSPKPGRLSRLPLSLKTLE